VLRRSKYMQYVVHCVKSLPVYCTVPVCSIVHNSMNSFYIQISVTLLRIEIGLISALNKRTVYSRQQCCGAGPFLCGSAPAPACQKFRLRLQLGPVSPYNEEKFNYFHVFKKFFPFLKDINDHQKVL
jgi:hypothetical protein